MRISRFASAAVCATAVAMLVSPVTSFTASQTQPRTAQTSGRTKAGFVLSRYRVLSKYAVDLTDLAAQNKLDRNPGHDAEINRLIAELAKHNKAPVIVGTFSLDRNLIASELACQLLSDSEASLANKHVVRLSLEALAKDAKTSAEFQSLAQAVFAEAAAANNAIILFVDQLHNYTGSQAAAAISTTIRQLLKQHDLQI